MRALTGHGCCLPLCNTRFERQQEAGRYKLVTCSAQRQPKDPRDYGSIEELRRALHAEAAPGQPSLAGLLNWLSSVAFGAGQPASGGLPGPGQTYRALLRSTWAQRLTSGLQRRPGFVALPAEWRWGGERERSRRVLGAGEARRVAALAALLTCSPASAAAAAARHPPLLDMPPGQLMGYLVALKEVLPGCDVGRMVAAEPCLFLSAPARDTASRVARAASCLRAGLPGADIDFLLEEDPAILFEEVRALEAGLARLADLWAVDAEAMAASDPRHLALAVRTLGPRGPPAAL